jgi:DNA-binding XRE family transcriptional regulator
LPQAFGRIHGRAATPATPATSTGCQHSNRQATKAEFQIGFHGWPFEDVGLMGEHLREQSYLCEANSVDANYTRKHIRGMSAKPSLPKKLPASDNLREVLAYNIRVARVTKGWSQEDLALECDLDRTYVSAVERARWNVSLSNIERFAIALDLAPWVLLKAPQ